MWEEVAWGTGSGMAGRVDEKHVECWGLRRRKGGEECGREMKMEGGGGGGGGGGRSGRGMSSGKDVQSRT